MTLALYSRPLSIWKWTLMATAEQTIMPPKGAVLLSAQPQNGALVLWALVDPKSPTIEARRIVILGTGHPCPEGLTYINTAVMPPFVWHVFEDRT